MALQQSFLISSWKGWKNELILPLLKAGLCLYLCNETDPKSINYYVIGLIMKVSL